MMMAQLPPELTALLSTKTVTYVTAGWVLLQSLGRLYHAIVSGGGVIRIWQALIYGTNTPTVKEAVTETVRQEVKAQAAADATTKTIVP